MISKILAYYEKKLAECSCDDGFLHMETTNLVVPCQRCEAIRRLVEEIEEDFPNTP